MDLLCVRKKDSPIVRYVRFKGSQKETLEVFRWDWRAKRISSSRFTKLHRGQTTCISGAANTIWIKKDCAKVKSQTY